jgi:uncharacterized protein
MIVVSGKSVRLLYLDSSALVKLLIEEPESAALQDHIDAEKSTLVTSRLALVEVPRATAIANNSKEVQHETNRLLDSCLVIDVHNELLNAARRLTSPTIRTLDAIHLATALHVIPDQFIAYDIRLITAAKRYGLPLEYPDTRY